MGKKRLLVVDDEENLIAGLNNLLYLEFPDTEIISAANGAEALDRVEHEQVDMVLSDIRMPEMDGLELLPRLQEIDPSMTVVMMTAHATIELAINALKNGAYDFVCKPFDYPAVIQTVRKGLERTRLLRENHNLRTQVSQARPASEFIGQSPAMQRFQERLETVARTDYTVLVRGENGTGKELSARAIHRLSRRTDKPLIMVNCPAIPEHLLESELFGHTRGAFTGADKEKQGLLAEADGGTICLDEIGDISVSTQTKLLRFLQEGEVRQVGSTKTKKVDVRIIAMTNRDLEKQIANNSFRQDLFYRLNVVSLTTPSLREIKEDIPLICAHFVRQTCKELGVEEKRFNDQALTSLTSRPWPGNVRQLQNLVKQAVIFCPTQVIPPSFTQESKAGQAAVHWEGAANLEKTVQPEMDYKTAKESVLREFSNHYLGSLLTETGGNVSRAALKSGLSRAAFQKIINKFSIDISRYRKS